MSKQLITDVPSKKPLPIEKPNKQLLPREPSKTLLPDSKPNQGKTVFLITHRRNILSVADYLLVLKEGKLVNYGLRDTVLATLTGSPQPSPSNT